MIKWKDVWGNTGCLSVLMKPKDYLLFPTIDSVSEAIDYGTRFTFKL